MGSRNPLLKIDGFLGTQKPMLARPLRKMILKIIFSLMASYIFKAPGTQLLMKVLSLLPLSSAPLKTAKYMLWLDGMY